ncbi:phage tail sheath subtilisin-like domain-containing protein [Novosphingobium clariflavum]|uniref:Phage tail sheath subtilisin-like domain-containing protein n=1 Tax=Novosphingobium clariflavum TaxID=2029884 RepID=A0ABV6S2N6_9SPHN|nr:phage tail sheath subtilisin-like domain-containing protein [Novosphingobium clariflavum]
MSINFSNIPSNLRVPLFYAELDPRFANTTPIAQRGLLVGQMTAAGTYTPGVPVQLTSVADGIAGAGAGSVLAGMIQAWRENDKTGEVWVLPISDAGAATAAAGTLTITGTATGSGTIPLYIAGTKVSVAVAVGDTIAAIATNVAAQINAALVPVTATAAAGVVTLTARNKGLVGNEIDVRLSYLGSAGGETLPAGVAVAIVALTGGATNPTITTQLAALGDKTFDFIVSGLNDATSLDALKALQLDTTGRWSPMQQLYGHVFTAARGTAGTLATLGVGRNDQHLSIIGFNDSPSPFWVWAAAIVGQAAVSLRGDPALPLQYLTVSGVLAPPIASRFSIGVRNSTLLYSGISTWQVDASGNIVIENIITTYVTNSQGNNDNSYLEVETMFTLMYVLRFMRSRIETKFGRMKLAADGTRLIAGSKVVTPSSIRADQIAAYRELEEGGYVQKSDEFAANLIVEKDANTPNRVNVLWPGTLIEQLRVFAMLVQFRLT